MNALEIRGLTKSFPGFRLEGLDLTLPGGCILGLIGENGAGKSTTIKLILDMLHKDGGTVTILGRDNGRNIHLIKEEMGVVLDDVGLPDCLTAVQAGKVMAGTFRSWDGAAYEGYLRSLDIPADKAFRDLSRGNRMKLGIAIALSHHPKLLLLDEATSGLDPVVRDQVVEMLEEFTRDEGHSVLLSSHIVSDLERICDYIAFLHRGRLLLCEEKDRLLEEYGMVRCTPQQLAALDQDAILHRRENSYGAEAIVLRRAVPEGLFLGPVTIEELFVYMVKGER
ncbi:MAG: ABC transporter ATP-binding protein [Ruminococcaceae bacterium]|nr:ABC transporter ATP-binding protein [Oscillospiraceae bacterium]